MSTNPLGEGAGFLILSTGKSRRWLLDACLESIARHYPGAPVHVLADAPVDVPFTWLRPSLKDGTKDEGNDKDSRRYKTRAYKLSPFRTTVLIDDDTVIHKPFGTAQELLAGHLLAMVPDGSYTSLGDWKARAAPAGLVRIKDADQRFAWSEHAKASIPADHEQFPYYSSGVMVWTIDDAVERMFDVWHTEWIRFQNRDQQPLVTALIEAGLYGVGAIRTLPAAMNFVPERHGTMPAKFTAETPCNVLHFWKNKSTQCAQYLHAMGHPRPAKASTRREHFERLTAFPESPQMTPEQYRAIGSVIVAADNERRDWRNHPMLDERPINVLVFGIGHDSQFWKSLNPDGRTLFVEDDPKFQAMGREQGLEVLPVQYEGAVGNWVKPGVNIPGQLRRTIWDVILIDGPRGDKPGTPGRAVPIYWADQLRRAIGQRQRAIFLHDWQRPWEQRCAWEFLASPAAVIPGDGKRGDLAVWDRHQHIHHEIGGLHGTWPRAVNGGTFPFV